MTDFKLREITVYGGPLIRVFHHGLKDLQSFSLKHYSRLSLLRPGCNFSLGHKPESNATRMFGVIWQQLSSRIQSCNSEAVPKYGQHDYDSNHESNATALESEDDRIGAKKIDWQLECDYGEGDSLYFSDFFDPYLYFVLNLI